MEIATVLASIVKRPHPTRPLGRYTCNFLARSLCLLARECRAEGSHPCCELPSAGAVHCLYAHCQGEMQVSDLRKKNVKS